MSVISFRRRPKHQPKHALFAESEQSLPEALAEHDLPAAVPPGAYPPEDIPVPPARPAPPRGLHPYAAPLLNAPRKPGTRHTEPFRPDFAEEGARPRPYAPRNMPRPWLIPDTWRRREHPLTQQGRDLTVFIREHMGAITYPSPGASPSEAAAFFRRISVITGTRSTLEQPSQCVAWTQRGPAVIGHVPVRRGLAITAGPVAVTGPQRRLTGPQPVFTPHTGRAA